MKKLILLGLIIGLINGTINANNGLNSSFYNPSNHFTEFELRAVELARFLSLCGATFCLGAVATRVLLHPYFRSELKKEAAQRLRQHINTNPEQIAQMGREEQPGTETNRYNDCKNPHTLPRAKRLSEGTLLCAIAGASLYLLYQALDKIHARL